MRNGYRTTSGVPLFLAGAWRHLTSNAAGAECPIS